MVRFERLTDREEALKTLSPVNLQGRIDFYDTLRRNDV